MKIFVNIQEKEMNYYDEIKNILIDNIIGRKVREYKSN